MAIKEGLDQDKAVETIVGLYEDWKDARREKEDIWSECLQNYLVYVDESRYDNWPWRCKVADTFSQETADTIGSALRNALFPINEDFFEIVGDDPLGEEHHGTFQKYTNLMLHKMKFVERMGPWCKQLSILGNAPLLLTWESLPDTRRRRIRQTNTTTGERSFKTIDGHTKQYDGPGVEVLDGLDVVFNPMVRKRREATFIRRTLVPRDRVPTLYPGVNVKDLDDDELGSKPQEPSDVFKVQRARLFGVTDTLPTTKDDENADDVEVLELHGDVVVDGERHTDILAAVLNRKILAKFARNTFWAGRQIVWGTYDDLWFTPFGKGPLEPVRGTQQLIDTFSCQKADVLNLITNGCFAYVDDGVIDPESVYLRPRGGIEVGNIANIKELHPNANISLTYQEIEMLRSRGERSTGKSRFDMGQAPGGRRTAYEASLIRQGGGARDMDVVKHLANDVMEYVLEWIVGTIQQMKWDSNELGESTNDVLLGEYHVNYLGADLTAMRQFETQQMMLFLDMAGRYPALAEAVDAPTLVGEVARLFHFRRDVVKSRKQYEQEQQQKQMMAQAEAMQGGRTGNEGMMGPNGAEPVSEADAMAMAGEGA